MVSAAEWISQFSHTVLANQQRKKRADRFRMLADASAQCDCERCRDIASSFRRMESSHLQSVEGQ